MATSRPVSPGRLAKTPISARLLETVLYHAAEAMRVIVALAHPVLPNATVKIWNQLGQPGALAEVRIDQLAWGGLSAGTRIGEASAVFPRVEKSKSWRKSQPWNKKSRIRNASSATPSTTPATTPVPGHPAASQGAAAASAPAAAAAAPARIGIDDFTKVEMRVGQVKSAERVAGADKLLSLMVDIGDEVRQIVAGIATAYEPDKLVGRKVVVVVNLAPRKLRGVESNGMIVAASQPDGSPVLAGFLEDVPVGARLK